MLERLKLPTQLAIGLAGGALAVAGVAAAPAMAASAAQAAPAVVSVQAAPAAHAGAQHLTKAEAKNLGLVRIVKQTAHGPLVSFQICLTNGNHNCILGQGNGNDPILAAHGSGSSFTEDNCGDQSGNPVRAWKNSNTLYVHANSNGTVSMENDSTNGCTNNADKWIKVPSTNSEWISWNYTQSLSAAADVNGQFITQGAGWQQWTGPA